MSNRANAELQKNKRKDKVKTVFVRERVLKIIVAILLILFLIAMVGVMIAVFWRNNADESSDEESKDGMVVHSVVVGDGVTLEVRKIATTDYSSYGVSVGVESAYLLTPIVASDLLGELTIGWGCFSEDGSPTSIGLLFDIEGRGAVLVCFGSFDKPVFVTFFEVYGGELKATVRVTYAAGDLLFDNSESE